MFKVGFIVVAIVFTASYTRLVRHLKKKKKEKEKPRPKTRSHPFKILIRFGRTYDS